MAADLTVAPAPGPALEVETSWPSAERHLRAMGTDVHVLVVGPWPGPHLARALDRIEELEARWSRFLPTSEVSELNRRAGQPVAVSPDTLLLVERAILANRLTAGRFDATLGHELRALGYDRPFDQLVAALPSAASRATTVDPVERPLTPPLSIDAAAGTATVAPGRSFDPGGIGKGLAADVIVEELLADGAWGALVNLGGDLRVGGMPPSGPNWVVSIDHPRHGNSLSVAELIEGGLATSTTLRRRWPGPQGPLNHLLDPATRRPHDTGADYVTVIGPQAWLAEAAATALIGTTIGPDGPASALPPGCAALVVEGDAATRRLGPFADYERPNP